MKNWLRINLLAAIVVVGGFCLAWAQPKQLLRVCVETQAQAEQLARMPLDFASRSLFPYADIVADPREEQVLRSMGFRIKILESASALQKKLAVLGADMGAFHTYDEVTAELQAIAQGFPHITALHSLGTSWEERDIWAMLVSDHPREAEPEEPGVLYVGEIHAREIITPEIVLHLLNHLVNGYSVDPQVTRLVQTRRLWLVPMMNPDGHVQVESANRWWRKNRRPLADNNYGVDLNRNFGFLWGYDNLGSSPYGWSETYRGPEPFSEPETQAIRTLLTSQRFVAAIFYHSYGRLWLFPWGYAKLNTPHHEVFLQLAGDLAEHNDYTIGNTAMGTIYLVNGGSDDYLYGEQQEKNRIFGFTAEIGTTFFPTESDISRHTAEMLPASLHLAEVADILAKDPWRLLPPQASTLYAAPVDDDGRIRFFWQSLTSPPNTPVTFQMQELVGYRLGCDTAQLPDSTWRLHGFYKNDQTGYQDNSCYHARGGRHHRAYMTMTAPLLPQPQQMLRFKIRYQFLSGKDYLYVRVLQDHGKNYVSIDGNITSTDNPLGYNMGNGITGQSQGWVEGRFDLSPFYGQPIQVQFLCVFDSDSEGEVFIDDIEPVAIIDDLQTMTIAAENDEFMLKKRKPGPYVFRLRGIDADGQFSHWSHPLEVTVDFGEMADINRDGLIDQADIDRCRDIILGLGAKPTAGEIYRADLDASDEQEEAVTVLDLIHLVRKIY